MWLSSCIFIALQTTALHGGVSAETSFPDAACNVFVKNYLHKWHKCLIPRCSDFSIMWTISWKWDWRVDTSLPFFTSWSFQSIPGPQCWNCRRYLSSPSCSKGMERYMDKSVEGSSTQPVRRSSLPIKSSPLSKEDRQSCLGIQYTEELKDILQGTNRQ